MPLHTKINSLWSRICTNHILFLSRKRQENNNPEKRIKWHNINGIQSASLKSSWFLDFHSFIVSSDIFTALFWLHNIQFDITFIQLIFLVKELKIHTFCGRWERLFTWWIMSHYTRKIDFSKRSFKSVWMKRCADVSHQFFEFLFWVRETMKIYTESIFWSFAKTCFEVWRICEMELFSCGHKLPRKVSSIQILFRLISNLCMSGMISFILSFTKNNSAYSFRCDIKKWEEKMLFITYNQSCLRESLRRTHSMELQEKFVGIWDFSNWTIVTILVRKTKPFLINLP